LEQLKSSCMRCAGIAGRDKHNQRPGSSIAGRKLTQTNMTLGRASLGSFNLEV